LFLELAAVGIEAAQFNAAFLLARAKFGTPDDAKVAMFRAVLRRQIEAQELGAPTYSLFELRNLAHLSRARWEEFLATYLPASLRDAVDSDFVTVDEGARHNRLCRCFDCCLLACFSAIVYVI
jgi:hypothetical protein